MTTGSIVCSIAPDVRSSSADAPLMGKAVNTRNSEGSFLRTRDGRILFVYSRFEDQDCNDDANADIVCIESADGGRSWSDFRTIFTAGAQGFKNIMSVTLRRMANGDVGLFYFCRLHDGGSKYVLWRSADEGASFHDPVYCIDVPGYYVVNNDRVLMLSDRRIIIPAAYHPPMPGANRYGVSMVAHDRFFISDDDGRTWTASPAMVSPAFSHTRTGLQEPGLVELSTGVIWGYARTDMGRQYEFFSQDRGESWTQAAPSAFTSPASPMLIKRDPYTEKLVSVWNPYPVYPGRYCSAAGWGRTPLAIAESADDGRTWSEPLILEDSPEHGYCYPALHFEPDCLLLSYCAGGPEDGICLNRTVIRRLER